MTRVETQSALVLASDSPSSLGLVAGAPSTLESRGAVAASGLVRTGGSVTFLSAGLASSLVEGGTYPASGLDRIDLSDSSLLAGGAPPFLAAGGEVSGLVRTGGSVTFLSAGLASSLVEGGTYPASGLDRIDLSDSSLAAGAPPAFAGVAAVPVPPLPAVGGSGVITVSKTIWYASGVTLTSPRNGLSMAATRPISVAR